MDAPHRIDADAGDAMGAGGPIRRQRPVDMNPGGNVDSQNDETTPPIPSYPANDGPHADPSNHLW